MSAEDPVSWQRRLMAERAVGRDRLGPSASRRPFVPMRITGQAGQKPPARSPADCIVRRRSSACWALKSALAARGGRERGRSASPRVRESNQERQRLVCSQSPLLCSDDTASGEAGRDAIPISGTSLRKGRSRLSSLAACFRSRHPPTDYGRTSIWLAFSCFHVNRGISQLSP